MKYMFGVAFVASLFQGNFELAFFIAGCFGALYWATSIYSRSLDKTELSKLTKILLQDKSDWKIIRFKDSHSKSSANLIYSPDIQEVVFLRKLTSNSNYTTTSVGSVLSAEVVEFLPSEIFQPAANVKIKFSDHYDEILCISGEQNWNLLKSDFGLSEVEDKS